MAGKGDKRRPGDEKKYKDNWDRIFGKRKREDFPKGYRKP